jgi:exopolysaccharide production protein ExoZ
MEGVLAKGIGHLDYIDALRGYAILGVIAVHASQSVPQLEWPLRLLADQGARGVQLFFVVSALTLMLSWNERRDGVLPFYVRRIFRIAPMFWLAMAFFMVAEAFALPVVYWSPLSISWATIFATATFTFGLHPQTIRSIVPGGWSIADEMTFYLLFPLLVATLRSWPAAVLALIAAVCLSMLMAALARVGWLFPQLDRDLVGEFVYVSFSNQFPAFVGGILVYHLLREFPAPASRNTLRFGLLASAIAIVAVPFLATALHSRSVPTTYLMPDTYVLPFALCTWCLAKGGGGLIVNRAALYLGKVSYSAYFVHFPVLGALSYFGLFPNGVPAPGWLQFAAIMVVASALTVAVSSITYRLVEVPMIRIGRQLALRPAVNRVPVSG